MTNVCLRIIHGKSFLFWLECYFPLQVDILRMKSFSYRLFINEVSAPTRQIPNLFSQNKMVE